MDSWNVRGKVVFITGGGQGIAAATASKLVRGGAIVALVDRNKETIDDMLAVLGGAHHGIVADVTDSESLNLAVSSTLERYGRIDVVFACAGIGSESTVLSSDVESLIRIIDVNLSGVIRTVKATLPEIIKQSGYILLISSASALKNMPRANAYAASKVGVEAFGGALRLEVAHKGVSVGVAYPTWVATPMITGSGTRAGESKTLPWPFSVVSSVETCADHLFEAIVKRRRSIFIPRSLRIMDILRWTSKGALWDRYMARSAEDTVKSLEPSVSAKK